MADPKALLDGRNDFTFFQDGTRFQGIRANVTRNGTFKYMQDGGPIEFQFPRNNRDTGRFFAIFDE